MKQYAQGIITEAQTLTSHHLLKATGLHSPFLGLSRYSQVFYLYYSRSPKPPSPPTLYSSSPKSAIEAALSTQGFHTTASGKEGLFVISNTAPVDESET